MADEPFYSRDGNHRRRPASILDGAQSHEHGERQVRTHAEAGVELQLLMNGELFLGQRYRTRELALDEATTVRARLEAEGWTEKGNL